eukprot:3723522-Amphidinium_carterae.1
MAGSFGEVGCHGHFVLLNHIASTLLSLLFMQRHISCSLMMRGTTPAATCYESKSAAIVEASGRHG